MSNFSQFFGGGVKSVQRGTISIGLGLTSATVTVSAVDPAKAVLLWAGVTTNAGDLTTLGFLVLTNATTITAQRHSNESYTTTISWQLVEYY